ncbi:hypothetical protein D6855_12560 [Butyrivibrio sp. CB08]|uniref:sulfotransferase family 2 domain-containing protein n=1 Tax=Butyrivibrio sp. CB08 TaxID=2364879 RepID=UPI000EAA47C4|nr:sulfotransferase family 2 domain-containing protein [Butyrivibrio sp. CB08]RKM57875.1 hypothetical protein D6855_12560 [Butyrivibrio sp. CB08]
MIKKSNKRFLVVLIHNVVSRSKMLRFLAVNAYDTFSLIVYGVMRRRQYIEDNDRKVIYMVNPKVACSSIQECIIGEKFENENDIHLEMEQRGLIHYGCPPKKTENYYKFSIVRNPFSRLVSCYEYRYHKKIIVNGRLVREYDSYLWGKFSKDEGFKKFADKVCMTPDSLSDQTFISQTYLLYDNGKRLVDDIGKIENLQDDFAIIRRKSGLGEIGHSNSSTRAQKNWRDYYDQETACRVYERYKNDFEMLGYKDELEKLLIYIQNRNIDKS